MDELDFVAIKTPKTSADGPANAPRAVELLGGFSMLRQLSRPNVSILKHRCADAVFANRIHVRGGSEERIRIDKSKRCGKCRGFRSPSGETPAPILARPGIDSSRGRGGKV